MPNNCVLQAIYELEAGTQTESAEVNVATSITERAQSDISCSNDSLMCLGDDVADNTEPCIGLRRAGSVTEIGG